MMLPLGTTVKDMRGAGIRGNIVGYGVLSWPSTTEINGDEHPQAVYLVQVAVGSSSLGPACVVMRADCAEESK